MKASFGLNLFFLISMPFPWAMSLAFIILMESLSKSISILPASPSSSHPALSFVCQSLYISLYGCTTVQCLRLTMSRSKLALPLSNQFLLLASFLRITSPSPIWGKAKDFRIMFGFPFLQLCV